MFPPPQVSMGKVTFFVECGEDNNVRVETNGSNKLLVHRRLVSAPMSSTWYSNTEVILYFHNDMLQNSVLRFVILSQELYSLLKQVKCVLAYQVYLHLITLAPLSTL